VDGQTYSVYLNDVLYQDVNISGVVTQIGVTHGNNMPNFGRTNDRPSRR